MAKGTSDAEARNAHTPRTTEALERIQYQLDNGSGQVETGVDNTFDRIAEDRERLGL